ncbi:hypothetical protein KIPB_015768, partial [Kipferlia bialata]|eukprot:g15768.t1
MSLQVPDQFVALLPEQELILSVNESDETVSLLGESTDVVPFVQSYVECVLTDCECLLSDDEGSADAAGNVYHALLSLALSPIPRNA